MKRSLLSTMMTLLVLAWAFPALAADPCTTDADCPSGASCIDGICVGLEDPDDTPVACETDGDCDEGWTCLDGFCADLNQNPDPLCATAADCAEDEDCIKGMCLPHEEGLCDADDDCLEGEVCAWHTCEPAESFCESDEDCGAWESCEVECVLYSYADGSFDNCVKELGYCQLDPEKVEVPAACVDFCAHLAPCMEADLETEVEVEYDGGEDSGSAEAGKEDDIADEEMAEMVAECEFVCAIGLSEDGAPAEMQALIDCALAEETCDAMESECQDEAEALADRLFEELGAEVGDDIEQGGDGDFFGIGEADDGSEPPDGNGEENEEPTAKGETGDDGGSSGCGVAMLPSSPASILMLLFLGFFAFLLRRWQ
jgi:hypothetical protein